MRKTAERRQQLRALLIARDLDGVAAWAQTQQNPFRLLFSLLFDPDEILRWRAVEAAGQMAAVMAEAGQESVREVLRRVLWLMNDESGGLLWQGPEVIGEILVQVPDLRTEFAPLLPPYLLEKPFERGAAWALARLARIQPALWQGREEELSTALADPDPFVRAHVAVALEALGRAEARSLSEDRTPISVYDLSAGILKRTTVGTLMAAIDGRFPPGSPSCSRAVPKAPRSAPGPRRG